jgi:acetylornithine/succinyldiaminopimelate/putrescine aminotransferase
MDRTEQVVLHTYNRFPVVFEKGEGVCLTDADGKEYLDFGAGIAVFALGYGNKSYNDALKNQIDKLIHTSNLYYHKPLCEAAEKIIALMADPEKNKAIRAAAHRTAKEKFMSLEKRFGMEAQLAEDAAAGRDLSQYPEVL